MCVNCMMNFMFEEVVDHAVDGKLTAEQYFKDQENMIGTGGCILRLVGMFLCVLGFYLLF